MVTDFFEPYVRVFCGGILLHDCKHWDIICERFAIRNLQAKHNRTQRLWLAIYQLKICLIGHVTSLSFQSDLFDAILNCAEERHTFQLSDWFDISAILSNAIL